MFLNTGGSCMVSPQYEISDVFAITMTLEAAEGFLPSVNS